MLSDVPLLHIAIQRGGLRLPIAITDGKLKVWQVPGISRLAGDLKFFGRVNRQVLFAIPVLVGQLVVNQVLAVPSSVV